MVAQYARHHGIRKAARHYCIHHRDVQRWVKDQVNSLKNPKKHLIKKGQDRKVSYPQELEERIVSWILEKREEKFVAVSTQSIHFKELSLIKGMHPNFKASGGWLQKFMKRNNLVLCVQTHYKPKFAKRFRREDQMF